LCEISQNILIIFAALSRLQKIVADIKREDGRMFSPFKDIAALFFPPLCPACGRVMAGGEGFLCTACQWEMPLTGYENQADNPVVRRFWGLVPVRNATAFLWFTDGSGFRRVVHAFKYGGRWALARDLGRWFGRVLADTDAYAGVDVIVPVPLHYRKILKRGYNQSEYIARGVAAAMERPVETRAVVRRVNNPSQTRTRAIHERWENVEDIFDVRRAGRLAGKHILLVDDVMTTGATVGSCAEAIVAAVPGCRVSIAVLYASKQGLGIKE
jgi:ComF family protein